MPAGPKVAPDESSEPGSTYNVRTRSMLRRVSSIPLDIEEAAFKFLKYDRKQKMYATHQALIPCVCCSLGAGGFSVCILLGLGMIDLDSGDQEVEEASSDQGAEDDFSINEADMRWIAPGIVICLLFSCIAVCAFVRMSKLMAQVDSKKTTLVTAHGLVRSEDGLAVVVDQY